MDVHPTVRLKFHPASMLALMEQDNVSTPMITEFALTSTATDAQSGAQPQVADLDYNVAEVSVPKMLFSISKNNFVIITNIYVYNQKKTGELR